MGRVPEGTAAVFRMQVTGGGGGGLRTQEQTYQLLERGAPMKREISWTTPWCPSTSRFVSTRSQLGLRHPTQCSSCRDLCSARLPHPRLTRMARLAPQAWALLGPPAAQAVPTTLPEEKPWLTGSSPQTPPVSSQPFPYSCPHPAGRAHPQAGLFFPN